MILLPGESNLSQSVVEGLSLTTHRVRYDRPAPAASELIGITLDAVSSCGVASKSYPLLLLLAALAAFGGLVLRDTDGGPDQNTMPYSLLVIAAVLVLAYFLSRKAVLVISSAGQSILIPTKGAKPDALRASVEDVEQAKLRYLGKVSG